MQSQKFKICDLQQGEMLYVLEDVLSERNRVFFIKEREERKKLKKQYEKEGNIDKKEKLRQDIEQLTKVIEENQITVYDLFKDAIAMTDFIEKYKSLPDNHWEAISFETQTILTEFSRRVYNFARRLFETGIPVEFCDGNQGRMSDKMIDNVFVCKTKANKQVVSVAVAGPQSSGKSTLLRHLFGIDARASAGRTTKGINCCRIDCDDKEIILVDSEGVGAPELISEQKESDSGTKKDNKIMLGALASSRVFILNFMRSGKFAQCLDVILWAYEKLNLGEQKGRSLSSIKFVFVIRDVSEYNNDGWLDSQKAEIRNYLEESLKNSPKYVDSKKNIRIED
ncbi:very large inducible GTPase 1, partial [Reticulomyxa filosa]